MMQLQRFDAGDPVVLAPTIGRQIRAAAHQPVQHGQEDRPLEGELVPARPRQVVDHRPAAGRPPEALEHQGRPDPPHRRARLVLRRGHNQRALCEARSRAHQPLQLAARLEGIQSAQGSDHPLADLAADPPALGDLEIDASAGDLLAEIHARLLWRAHNRATCCMNQAKSTTNVALHVWLRPPPALGNLRLSGRLASANCRRWV
jgi:hypothetical protein